jgi:hypothetical protein
MLLQMLQDFGKKQLKHNIKPNFTLVFLQYSNGILI